MKARIGLFLFIFVFLITVVGSLMRQAMLRSLIPLSHSVLIIAAERFKALFRTQNWLKIGIGLSGWKNFMQRAS